MTADVTEMLAIIEEAIKAEVAAYNRYTRGAERATSDQLKELFSALAREEQRHRERLIAEYETLAGRSWEEWT